MGRARRTAGMLAAATALVIGSSACASEESPAEAAPEISARLDRIDAAIEAENYGRARDAVRALVADTEAARDDGAISDDQADRILDAASELLTRLPEEDSDELPNPDGGLPTDLVEPDAETEQPDPPPADEGEEGGDDENGGNDEGEGNDEKKDKDEKGGKDKGDKSDAGDD